MVELAIIIVGKANVLMPLMMLTISSDMVVLITGHISQALKIHILDKAVLMIVLPDKQLIGIHLNQPEKAHCMILGLRVLLFHQRAFQPQWYMCDQTPTTKKCLAQLCHAQIACIVQTSVAVERNAWLSHRTL